MSTKTILLAARITAALGAIAVFGIAGAASAETRWDHNHPRQHEVFNRVAREEHRAVVDHREGLISGRQEHHILASDHRIAREDRHLSRVNGGYISRGEQRALNRQENRVGARLP
jgi:hypothetical protein